MVDMNDFESWLRALDALNNLELWITQVCGWHEWLWVMIIGL